jgi:hypothetical protein
VRVYCGLRCMGTAWWRMSGMHPLPTHLHSNVDTQPDWVPQNVDRLLRCRGWPAGPAAAAESMERSALAQAMRDAPVREWIAALWPDDIKQLRLGSREMRDLTDRLVSQLHVSP